MEMYGILSNQFHLGREKKHEKSIFQSSFAFFRLRQSIKLMVLQSNHLLLLTSDAYVAAFTLTYSSLSFCSAGR